jgi:murein DD-endopeptidase MepM/ murein hydrolase activator NlpD
MMEMQIKRQNLKGKNQKGGTLFFYYFKGVRQTSAVHFCLLIFAFCLLISPAFSQTGAISWTPEKPINGAPCIFRYKAETPLKSLSGTFLTKRVFFNFDKSKNEWIGFAGVDYDTKPDSYELVLNGVATNGTKVTFAQIVPIDKGFYRTSAISVPKKYVDPDPADAARIISERDFKNEVLNKISTTQLWSGSFTAAAGISTSSEFGSQRTYNGKRQSVHQGLDYRATVGTPVRAINGGKVIIARELYFEGNCVVIDHGQGLLSLYFHLSQFKIKEGDTITKGQLIALSGGTGRVTGPHLHLAVRWQGSYVNPATLLGLKM